LVCNPKVFVVCRWLRVQKFQEFFLPNVWSTSRIARVLHSPVSNVAQTFLQFNSPVAF
jgi:hypothetical protein